MSNVNIMDSLSTSDHNMILCDVHMAATNNLRKGTRFDYNKADYKGIKKELGNTDWDGVLVGDAQECWNVFNLRLRELEEKFVPRKT